MHAVATPEGLWQEFSDALLVYFRRRVQDPADAEDVLQDTMVRIVRHRGQLPDVHSVSGWVWSIARSALRDYQRRNRRHGGLTIDPMVDVPTDDDRVDMACCVGPLLSGLRAVDREALMLVDVQGVTQAEAARRLGLSVSGMKSRVQRSRSRLKALIESCCAVTLDVRSRPIAMVPRPSEPSSVACRSRPGCTPEA